MAQGGAIWLSITLLWNLYRQIYTISQKCQQKADNESIEVNTGRTYRKKSCGTAGSMPDGQTIAEEELYVYLQDGPS